MTRLQADLDETKIILHNTISAVLQRGEKLDDLVAKSEDLSSQSKMFYKTARKTNQCCSLIPWVDFTWRRIASDSCWICNRICARCGEFGSQAPTSELKLRLFYRDQLNSFNSFIGWISSPAPYRFEFDSYWTASLQFIGVLRETRQLTYHHQLLISSSKITFALCTEM